MRHVEGIGKNVRTISYKPSDYFIFIQIIKQTAHHSSSLKLIG